MPHAHVISPSLFCLSTALEYKQCLGFRQGHVLLKCLAFSKFSNHHTIPSSQSRYESYLVLSAGKWKPKPTQFIYRSMRSILLHRYVCSLINAAIFMVLLNACTPRPFVPVSRGREYGNPKTPWVVSHVPEANRWALARTDHHNVFQKVICFHYPCRKMIGRRKVLKAISYEKLKKRVKKNAKKGAYQNNPSLRPAGKPAPVDTVLAQQEIVKQQIVQSEDKGMPGAPTPILKADSLITLNELFFETNSYKLKNEHYAELDLLSEFLTKHPTLDIVISGHTDNVGTEHHNVTLSLRRAESVAQYIIDKGVVLEKVYFEGLGSSQPIAGNDTEQGRSKNRRVEILIRNPKEK